MLTSLVFFTMHADIQEKNVQKERLHNCLEQIMWVCRGKKKRQKVKEEPEVDCKGNLNRKKRGIMWMYGWNMSLINIKTDFEDMLFAVCLLCRVLQIHIHHYIEKRDDYQTQGQIILFSATLEYFTTL